MPNMHLAGPAGVLSPQNGPSGGAGGEGFMTDAGAALMALSGGTGVDAKAGMGNSGAMGMAQGMGMAVGGDQPWPLIMYAEAGQGGGGG